MPTRGQSILVETPESVDAQKRRIEPAAGAALVGWITQKVNIWEDVRNRGYQRLWGEYWRMWRGKWNEADMNRLSERSKLVAPALAQSIEQTVSEIEEAIFSRKEWFDTGEKDKLADELMALLLRDQLIDDLDKVNAKDQIMEAITNGAIFGTMVAKVNVFVGHDQKLSRDTKSQELKSNNKKRVFVAVESIRPDEFVPDPVGKDVQQMEGCAQRIQRTMHYVLERIEQGVYRKDALAQIFPTRRLKNSDVDQEDPQSINTTYESGQVDLIEYHGKVPLRYMTQLGKKEAKSAIDRALNAGADRDEVDNANGEGPYVEAIVTIANNGVLLRAMVNPFTMQDRAIVAAQFEKVPGRFWGRGVAEKGYNPQKALDAELRARMDALGYISAPMLGVDSGRLPRGFRFEVKPGKVWTTQGPPKDVLQPVQVGDYNTLTFQQTQEMERMVQMGTGSFDTASALKAQSQSGANGASSNSALMGAFVKRSKRSIANISRNFVHPIVQKCLWRYMQFDPIRYPKDFDISIKTTIGIVAREVEAMQMTQLMGMMPPDFHQVQLVLAKGIIENTSLSNKGEILKVIDAVINPSPQAQQAAQAAQQAQQALAAAQTALAQAEAARANAQADLAHAQAFKSTHEAQMEAQGHQVDISRLQLEQHEQAVQAGQLHISAAKLPIDRLKAMASMVSAKAAETSAEAAMHKAKNPPKPAASK
jgi:hypothetical protein